MRILFLQKRILFPPDSGGKLRTLNVLRHLARWHAITYLCNVQSADAPYLDAMRELGVELETIAWREVPRESVAFYRDLARNVFSPYPFNVAKDFDPALRRRAETLLAQRPYDLVICDFVQMALNALGLSGPPKVLFQHNVEAQIFARHAELDDGWLRRRYMALQFRKMRRFEALAGRQFDTVVAVSPQDRQYFESHYGWHNVQVIDTAVDLDYFQPREDAPESERIVFIGSMDWLPNQDGAEHFVRNIWPTIRRANGAVEFQIVGRNPPQNVQRLAEVEGVEVVGTVPDVRPYLAGAAVIVVPLRIGGGTRIKIFEAMAMGKAVVSTHLGAEGLPVESGRHLLLADEPDAMARAILELLNRPELRKRLGDEARQLVCQRFSAETVARQFDDICQRTVESRRGLVTA